ncbi:MAG: hypothetical protein KC931_17370, partial [Candidatus Omnitrophica bacterium]|nr:hypothetical protein [Candidatus Omnitrophota bacterium]
MTNSPGYVTIVTMRLGRITGPYLLLTLVLVGSTPSTRAQLGLGDIPALEDGIPIKTVDAFRFQLDVLLAAEREPIDDLNAGYRRALEKLESDLQSAGKLQELLAVREELKKFIGGPDSYLPAESTDKDIAVPDLEKLRSTYRRERLRRNQEVARRSQAHLVTIKKELQDLQVGLTKADRIEDALLAVQTIEAID